MTRPSSGWKGLPNAIETYSQRKVATEWEYDEKFQEWLVAIGDPVGKANPIGKAYKLLSDDFQSMVSLLRITRLVKEKGGWDKIGSRLDG